MAKIVHLDRQLQNHLTFIVNAGKEDERHYDGLEDFAKTNGKYYQGFYCASRDGKYGLINSSGYEVITPKYDNLRPFHNVTEFYVANAPYFVAQLDNLQGIINYQGEIIFPFKYEKVEDVNFRRNTATISCHLEESGVRRFGIANSIDGEIIIPMEYQAIYFSTEGYYLRNPDNLWGFADMGGKILVECKYHDTFHLCGKYNLAYVKLPHRQVYKYDVIARDGSVIGHFESRTIAKMHGEDMILICDYPASHYLYINQTADGYSIDRYKV